MQQNNQLWKKRNDTINLWKNESKKFVICVKENLKMKNDKNAFKI